jgi:hypothetical protein
VNGPGALEGLWREWLGVYRSGGPQGFPSDFASAGFDLKSAQFRQFKFTNSGPAESR